MRVTNNMLISNLLYNVNSNLVKMSEYQDELATGKKIQSPSDDPVGISKVLKYKTDLSQLEQYTTNTQDALSWLETTEIALIDVSEALQRVRELTVQAANGSNAPDDLDKIKSEIEQLKNHIVSASNTTYAGRYIFSSYQTDEKLMNDDGTFNLDITNYEIFNAPVTQYEIGTGDVMDVSTNGLDLFGAIELDNLMNTAIPDNVIRQLVGDIDLSASYETVTSAVHQGIYDLSGDYSAENMNITLLVNGESMEFDVDESLLDGSGTVLTEQQVIDFFSDAENAEGEKLSDYAEVKFDTGVFSITSYDQGEKVMISGANAVFAHQSLQATINPSQSYTSDHDFDITIDIGGVATTYAVDESAFNGTLDQAGVVSLFENADDGFGNLLSSVADVYYNSSGKLIITPTTQLPNQNISVADSSAFDGAMNVGIGDGGESWNIRVGDIVYDVDEAALDGSGTPLTEDEFIDVIEQATAFSPYSGILKDVADVYFNNAGELIIEPKAADADLLLDGPVNYFVVEDTVTDTVQFTTSASKAQMKGYFDKTSDYTIKKATMESEFDLSGDYTSYDLDITMSISGTSYTFAVDESVLNGSVTELTEDDVLAAFKNADDGSGNSLSDFAEVEFDEEGNLIIEARQHGEEVIMSGGASVFGQKSLISSFNTASNYTASNFNVTITRDGNSFEYEVDESQLDGSLSKDEIVAVFENATIPTGGKLGNVADIYFDTSGHLVITASSSNQDVHISSADAVIFGTAVNVGKGEESDNLDITIDGITYDVDEKLLDGSDTELTNEEIALIFQSAKAYQPEEGVLSDVADVYFDELGELVIQSKVFGDSSNITGAETVFNTTALKGPFDLSGDYTGDTLDITVDGVVYSVDESLFDGSGSALTEDEVIENMGDATNGTNKLSDVADIYFSSSGDLIVQVKNPSADTEIAFGAGNSIFAGTVPTNIGRETQEIETPTGGYISDEMVSAATDEQSFVITLDGETKSITLDMDSYTTVEEYVLGMDEAIDKAFPPQADIEIDIVGEEGQEALVFRTVNSKNDGTIREFDIRAVRSTTSQMIQDFDDLIEALDADNINAYNDAEQAVEDAQEALEEAEIEAKSGDPEAIAAVEVAQQNLEDAEAALAKLDEESVGDVSTFITKFQDHLDNINTIRSDIGGKTNRMELVLNRIGDDTINYTQLLSNAEDADMSEIIMKLKNAENVYQASLSTGARVIQPSLIDFIS